MTGQLYSSTFDNLEEMDRFLETHRRLSNMQKLINIIHHIYEKKEKPYNHFHKHRKSL